jgi:lipopolysaccharide export system permease protein
MRWLRIPIIDRYVAREIVAPLMLGVTLLTFALVTGRLLKLTEMVVNRGVSLHDVLLMVAYIMPSFFELTFPMAVLLGVLLGFGRMSAERELIAARACGISLYRLAIPVLAIGIAVWGLASWFAFSVRPWANHSLSELLYHLSRTRSTAGLKEKIFNRTFPGIVLYVDQISVNDGTLHGVMISDDRNRGQQSTIIARNGVVLPDKERETVTLRLYNGSIFGLEAENHASHVTSFKIYDLNVEPESTINFAILTPDEMNYATLRQTIADARAGGHPNYFAESEWAGKFTVPFASVLFAILGIPLGLKPARGGQSERFGVAIALFFFYYALMRVGENLAQSGQLGSLPAMCIPDLLFGLLAVWLFVQGAGDRTDQGRGPGDIIWDLVERFERSRQAA